MTTYILDVLRSFARMPHFYSRVPHSPVRHATLKLLQPTGQKKTNLAVLSHFFQLIVIFSEENLSQLQQAGYCATRSVKSLFRKVQAQLIERDEHTAGITFIDHHDPRPRRRQRPGDG